MDSRRNSACPLKTEVVVLSSKAANTGSFRHDYVMDGLGRAVTTINQGPEGTFGNGDDLTTGCVYDGAGRQATAYDKAGSRVTLQHDDAAVTAAYAYDSRDRCTGIDQYNGSAWVDLADYTWLGNALSKRETTCDYPGGTKPKFKTEFARDGLLRVTKVDNRYLTANQSDSGYNHLGTFEYGYDAGSNVLSALQSTTMDELDADRWYEYDTLNRVITGRVSDTPNWTGATVQTSWYQYDDLGNRISHKYRTDAPIAYGHDKANRMTTLAGLNQGYDFAAWRRIQHARLRPACWTR